MVKSKEKDNSLKLNILVYIKTNVQAVTEPIVENMKSNGLDIKENLSLFGWFINL